MWNLIDSEAPERTTQEYGVCTWATWSLLGWTANHRGRAA